MGKEGVPEIPGGSVFTVLPFGARTFELQEMGLPSVPEDIVKITVLFSLLCFHSHSGKTTYSTDI